MKKYPIKHENKDFMQIISTYNTKGSRKKMIVVDSKGEKAFFKYEGDGYLVSEACSEKLCYEIAKVLNYPCARIELGKDIDGTIGILNYLFVQSDAIEHIDAISYLNIYEKERPYFYTISNIKKILDNLDKSLFADFIKIMIFDALVGEQDRHEENWGIEFVNNKYKISPLYDNGCSLLKEFKNEEFANKFYSG